MNDKKKKSNVSNSDINIDDLTKLENELNDLSNENITEESKSGLFTSSLQSVKEYNLNENNENYDTINNNNNDNNDNNDNNENLKVNFSDNTFFKKNNDKTWDGFNKFNNIPNNEMSEQPKMSREEL